MLNTLLCSPLKKQRHYIMKKLYCAGLVILDLLYMNLNYFSVNILPSHYSNFNVFVVAAMFLHAKITLYLNYQREGLCLQALRMRVNIDFGKPCRNDPIKWKNHPGETGVLICKSEISVVKNIWLRRDGIIFTCNQKCIF